MAHRRLWTLALILPACGGVESAPPVTAAPSAAAPEGRAAVAPEAATEAPPSWRALAVGGWHTCALDAQGHPWCWGAGGGRIGDGSLQPRPAPARVATPPLTTLDAGLVETCGIDDEGHAWCWGVGDAEPARAVGAHRLRVAVPGEGTTCGLDEDGAPWCWGHAGTGLLGREPNERRETVEEPEPIEGAPPLVSLQVGSAVACGLTAEGEAWCWGSGAARWEGEGDDTEGETESDLGPRSVGGELRFASLALAHMGFVCGRTGEGELWCWGRGLPRTDGVPGRSPEPVRIPLGEPVARAGAGSEHLCVALASGTLLCGEPGRSSALASVAEISDVAELEAGEEHGCLRTEEGSIRCWGSDTVGQLGDGPLPSEALPPIESPRRDAGLGLETLAEDCGVDGEGHAWCWRRSPEEVQGGHAFEELAEVTLMRCGRHASGEVRCWGRLDDHVVRSPLPIAGDHRFARIDGYREMCGLDESGGLWCWSRSDRTPERVAEDETFVALETPCALTREGVVLCWRSRSHELERVAADVPLRTISIASDGDRGCGLDEAGRAWCWGRNHMGQLGNGEAIWRREERQAVPVAEGTPPFVGVAVGRETRCGWTEDGEVWCWGSNRCGELGQPEGNGGYASEPVRVPLEGPVSEVVLGRDESQPLPGIACALGAELYCWGYGQSVPRPMLPSPLRALRIDGRAFTALDRSGDLLRWGLPSYDEHREPLRFCERSVSAPVAIPAGGR